MPHTESFLASGSINTEEDRISLSEFKITRGSLAIEHCHLNGWFCIYHHPYLPISSDCLHPHVHPSVHPCKCPSIHLSICISSVHASVHLSIHPFLPSSHHLCRCMKNAYNKVCKISSFVWKWEGCWNEILHTFTVLYFEVLILIIIRFCDIYKTTVFFLSKETNAFWI